MPNPRYLTVDEASDLTRLAKQSLYRKVCERAVPYTKLGGKLLFREDRLLAWMERGTFVPGANGKSGAK